MGHQVWQPAGMLCSIHTSLHDNGQRMQASVMSQCMCVIRGDLKFMARSTAPQHCVACASLPSALLGRSSGAQAPSYMSHVQA